MPDIAIRIALMNSQMGFRESVLKALIGAFINPVIYSNSNPDFTTQYIKNSGTPTLIQIATTTFHRLEGCLYPCQLSESARDRNFLSIARPRAPCTILARYTDTPLTLMSPSLNQVDSGSISFLAGELSTRTPAILSPRIPIRLHRPLE